MEPLRDPELVVRPDQVTFRSRKRTAAIVAFAIVYLLFAGFGALLVLAGVQHALAGDAAAAAFLTGFGGLFVIGCGVLVYLLIQARRFATEAIHLGGAHRSLEFVDKAEGGAVRSRVPLSVFDRVLVQPIVEISTDSDGNRNSSRSHGVCLAGPGVLWRIARFDRVADADASAHAISRLVQPAPRAAWPELPAREVESWDDAEGRHVRWVQPRRPALPLAVAGMATSMGLCALPGLARAPVIVSIVLGIVIVADLVLILTLRRMVSRVQVTSTEREIIVRTSRAAGVVTERTARVAAALDVALTIASSATLTLAGADFNTPLQRAQARNVADPSAAMAALGSLTALADATRQRPVVLDLGHVSNATAIAVWRHFLG